MLTIRVWRNNMFKSGITHHMSGLEGFSIKVCEAETVFWELITVLQLLRVTRGLVLVRVPILD